MVPKEQVCYVMHGCRDVGPTDNPTQMAAGSGFVVLLLKLRA